MTDRRRCGPSSSTVSTPPRGDLVAGQDALAPYTVALLSILAHWSVKSGGTTLSEEDYQQVALDTARMIWDALLTGRGIPVPARPPTDTAVPQ